MSNKKARYDEGNTERLFRAVGTNDSFNDDDSVKSGENTLMLRSCQIKC
jgi:hypothetical protein